MGSDMRVLAEADWIDYVMKDNPVYSEPCFKTVLKLAVLWVFHFRLPKHHAQPMLRSIFCCPCRGKKQIPPAPLQKGGRKSTWFFNSKRWNMPTRNLKYAPPFLKGGWGDLLSCEKLTVLVATQGRFFVGHWVVRAFVGSDVLWLGMIYIQTNWVKQCLMTSFLMIG